jgi:hypothetical protein
MTSAHNTLFDVAKCQYYANQTIILMSKFSDIYLMSGMDDHLFWYFLGGKIGAIGL